MYLNPNYINVFHIVVVAPLLILIGLGKIPQEYLRWLILLGVFVALFHLYRLISRMNASPTVEKMDGTTQKINGLNIHYIRMFDSSPGFETPVLNAKQNDVVIWTNVGEVEHTVTEVNEAFNSGYMKPGDRFSVKFTDKGVYDYYSAPDQGWMVGRVLVN